MTTMDLYRELKLIMKVHPETKNLQIWAVGDDSHFPVSFVGYDSGRRHTTKRVTLESRLED